jgi:hypothetical protein
VCHDRGRWKQDPCPHCDDDDDDCAQTLCLFCLASVVGKRESLLSRGQHRVIHRNRQSKYSDMTSSVDSTGDMAAAAAVDDHSSDDDDDGNNSTKDKHKSNDKQLKAGYNNGLKKRGGHSTKQDPNKVDTSGERVIEPRQVVSVV